MITIFEVYVIGMCVAFVMAIILAIHFERTRKEEEQQQWGMCAVAAIMSWLAVGLFIWRYRHNYKHFFKWLWTSTRNAVAKFF